jgi:hypothetical protein
MRVQVEWRSASIQCHEDFCKKYPDIKLTAKQYGEIIRTYNIMFRDYILETGEKAKMPQGIGQFSINKKKTRKYGMNDKGERVIRLPVDWVKTRKAGKYIYNFNYHTEGYKFRWIWFEHSAYFLKSDIWVFRPSRGTSRAIADKLLRDTSKNYADIYHEWK